MRNAAERESLLPQDKTPDGTHEMHRRKATALERVQTGKVPKMIGRELKAESAIDQRGGNPIGQ